MEQTSPPAHGDQNRGPIVVGLTGLTLFIAFISVYARGYVRWRIVRKFWWDDLFIAFALVIATFIFAIVIVEVQLGLGRDSFYWSRHQATEIAKWEMLSRSVFNLSVMCTRISVCILLYRISSLERFWNIFILSILGFIVVTNISTSILLLTSCQPIAKNWNPDILGSCWSERTICIIAFYGGVVGILSDLILAVLPVIFLWKVQLNIRVKVGVCVLMGLGLFTVVCAGIRFTLIPAPPKHPSSDQIFDLTIWGVLEEQIAIIAACLPTLRPLYHRLYHSIASLQQRFFRSKNSNRQTSGDQLPTAARPHRLSHNLPEYRSKFRVQEPTMSSRATSDKIAVFRQDLDENQKNQFQITSVHEQQLENRSDHSSYSPKEPVETESWGNGGEMNRTLTV